MEVGAELLPRYLWTVGSIEVYLDGSRILQSARLAFKGTDEATFNHDGRDHVVKLAWQVAVPYVGYWLSIDGQPVAQSSVRPAGWRMSLILPGIAIGVSLVACRLFVT